MTALKSTSPEADILRRIEILIRKLAKGEATPRDMQLLQDLQRARVNLMRPKFSDSDEPIRALA
jgi:hypothetical protein